MTASIAAWGCLIQNVPVGFKALMAVKPKFTMVVGDAHYADKTTKELGGANTKGPCWPPHPPATRPAITIGAANAFGGLPLGAATVTTAGSGGPVSQTALACFFKAADGTCTASGVVNTNGSGVVTSCTVVQPGWGYSNVGGALFQLVTAADPEYWLLRFDQIAREQDWQEWLAWSKANKSPAYLACDDHDELGDNWDWSVTKAGVATGGAVTDAAGVWAYSRIALRAGDAIRLKYFPETPMPGGQNATAVLTPGQYNGDRPPDMVTASQGAADGSDLRIRYWSKDYDENWVEGGTSHRILTLDCITYKSQLGVNSPTSTLLGATQEAWVKSQGLDAKNKKFNHVVIFSTKDLFNLNNTDGWCSYTTQRDRILQYLHDNGIPAIWVTFDRHTPHTSMARVNAGQTYDVVCACVCPMGNTGGYLDPYLQNIAQDNTGTNVFAEVRINSETGATEIIGRDVTTGDVQSFLSIPFGSRLPTPETMRFVRQPPANQLNVPQSSAATIAPIPASNATWINNTGKPGLMIVDGGTVSAVLWSGDGGANFHSLSNNRGLVYMRPGDQMRVTYSAVPTAWKWCTVDLPLGV